MLRKKISLILIILFTGIHSSWCQDTITGVKERKPLERDAFQSGIFIDNQTVNLPPATTLEFVLQHRFGTIKNGIEDFFGIWGASNIRLGLNFTITKDLLVGLGTTKNKRLQDLQLKWTFQRQRQGGFPVTMSYYGNFAMNLSNKSDFGKDYKFIDRLSYYHELMFARRFCNYFSLQISAAYTHINKVDTTMVNDYFTLAALARFKVTPQSSIMVTFSKPLQVNYDPAFIVRYPNNWISNPENAPYANVGIGWEICTSTHAFQLFFSAAPGIVPQEINATNHNDFFDGYILIGLNITRLWTF